MAARLGVAQLLQTPCHMRRDHKLATARATRVLICTLASSASLITACSQGVTAEQATDAAQGSLVGEPLLYWDNQVPIQVCWENPEAAEDDGAGPIVAEERRNAVKRIVENTWGRHANLRFSGWGEKCVDQQPGIHLRIENKPNGGGLSEIGTLADAVSGGVRMNFFVDPSRSGNPDQRCKSSEANRRQCIQGIAVHEFGHALGFHHAENRAGFEPEHALQATSGLTLGDCADLPDAGQTAKAYGAYDVASVMSYCGNPYHRVGARLSLSPGDIAGLQLAYGRKPAGSLLGADARCLGAPTRGSSLELSACNELVTHQQWQFERRRIRLGRDQCLHAESVSPGGAVTTSTCSTNPAQEWSFKATTVRGWGDLCLTAIKHSESDLIMLSARQCAGAPEQTWTLDEHGTLSMNGEASNLCASIMLGSLVLQDCNLPAVQRFELRADGTMRLKWNPDLCVEATAANDPGFYEGPAQMGVSLETMLQPCDPSQLRQKWHLRGQVSLMNSDLCLSQSPNSDTQAARVVPCETTDRSQDWSYYFK